MPTLTKAHTITSDEGAQGVYDADDVLTYTFTIRNVTNVTLKQFTIEDAFEDAATNGRTLGPITCDATSAGDPFNLNDVTNVLSPGESVVCSGTYTVTLEDVNAGTVVRNTAAVSALTLTDSPVVSNEASSSFVPAASAPDYTLAKSVRRVSDDAASGFEPGDVLEYAVTFANTGNVTLTNPRFVDFGFTGAGAERLTFTRCVLPTGLEQSVTAVGEVTIATDVEPGQSVTCYLPYSVQQIDVDQQVPVANNISSSATGPNGQAWDRTASISWSPAAPRLDTEMMLSIDDHTADKRYGVGDTVYYTLTVTNNSNVTINIGTITDNDFSGTGPTVKNGCDERILAPGDSTFCYASYVVTQADVDLQLPVTNKSVMNGFGPLDTRVPDESNIAEWLPVAPIRSLAVTKDGELTTDLLSDGFPSVGDTITYSAIIENTGNVTLTDVKATEVDFSASDVPVLSCLPTTLAPKEAAFCTGTWVVTQDAIDAGVPVTNVVEGSGTYDGTAATNTGTHTLDLEDPNPKIKLDAVVSGSGDGVAEVGETITYTFTATNTGNQTLDAADMVKGLFTGDGTPSDISCEADTTLSPGEEFVCTVTYQTTQGDVDKSALMELTTTVSASTPAGDPVTASITALGVPAPQAPALTVAVEASEPSDAPGGSWDVGETVTFTYTVTNTGNVTLDELSVIDAEFTGTGPVPVIECTVPDSLAPGASYVCTSTYVITQADVDKGAPVTENAQAFGTSPLGERREAIDEADAAPMAGPAPQISVQVTHNTPDDGSWDSGDVVNYTYTVTNSGNLTLGAPELTPGVFDGAGPRPVITCDPPTNMAPNASYTCTAAYTITQDDVDAGIDIVERVSVTANTPERTPGAAEVPPTVSATGQVAIAPAVPAAAIDVQVVASTPGAGGWAAGDTVSYTITVTNNGGATLNDPTIRQGEFTGTGTPPVVSCPEPDELAPRASYTCTVTYVVAQADIDAGHDIVENVSVAARPATGDPEVNDTAAATITMPFRFANIDPVMTVALTDDADGDGQADVGDVITYTVTATNSGNITVSELVADVFSFNGAEPTGELVCPDPTTLAPGEVFTCTVNYTVTQADIDAGEPLTLQATVIGQAPNGGQPGGAAGATMPLAPQAPAVTLDVVTSEPADGRWDAGDTVTYTFTITNPGNVTLTNVTVSDDSFGGTGELVITCELPSLLELTRMTLPAGTLAPGQQMVCTATYVLTGADIQAGGQLILNARVTGTSPTGAGVSATDQAAISIPQPEPDKPTPPRPTRLPATGADSGGTVAMIALAGLALFLGSRRRRR